MDDAGVRCNTAICQTQKEQKQNPATVKTASEQNKDSPRALGRGPETSDKPKIYTKLFPVTLTLRKCIGTC